MSLLSRLTRPHVLELTFDLARAVKALSLSAAWAGSGVAGARQSGTRGLSGMKTPRH